VLSAPKVAEGVKALKGSNYISDKEVMTCYYFFINSFSKKVDVTVIIGYDRD